MYPNIAVLAGPMIPTSKGLARGYLDQNNPFTPIRLLPEKQNYIRLKLIGSDKNPDAIGASAIIYHKNHKQKQSLLSGRGYLSQSELVFQFGLNQEKKADSIQIWMIL